MNSQMDLLFWKNKGMFMKKKLLFASAFIFIISFATSLFALEVPALKEPVTDIAGILSSKEKQKITNFLLEDEKKSQLQIAVLILPSLEDDSMEDYSIRVAQSWKLGSKKKDSGALLLVSVAERKLRIEVGYGLEANLTDAVCSQIIRNVIAPEFRNKDYGAGIFAGVKAMTAYALKDETLIKEFEDNDDDLPVGSGVIVLMFLAIYFFGSLATRNPFWLFYVLNSMSRSSGTFKSSGSSFGSSFSRGSFGGGGGYSGGGGSFGGGGASGGW